MSAEPVENTETQRVFDFTCSVCEEDERGTYRLQARCSNCGAEGVAVYSKSHDALADRCPDCETTNVRPVIPKVAA